MKLHAITTIGIVLDLDATDCLSLADACRHALRYDMPGDRDLLAAHETALRLGAVVAAFDTLTDGEIPEAAMLADVRRVWGPTDTSVPGRAKAPEPKG